MRIKGKVVSKTITDIGVFARVQILEVPKGLASMRFFDVPDEENFIIGEKVDITITEIPQAESRAHVAVEELEQLPPAESLSDACEIPGCVFHSAPCACGEHHEVGGEG